MEGSYADILKMAGNGSEMNDCNGSILCKCPKYRQRNIIERMFGWLKENRRIVTRFDKLAKSYAAMVSLVCTMRCLLHYFSYRTWRTSPQRLLSRPVG